MGPRENPEIKDLYHADANLKIRDIKNEKTNPENSTLLSQYKKKTGKPILSSPNCHLPSHQL
jgi:hypothetical protein